MVQLFIEGILCFVDLRNKEVYSAKMHKLKRQKFKNHNKFYISLKYNGKRITKSLEQLIALANEKLQSEN